MKYKFLLGALLMGCSFSAFADGYTDGIEYYEAGQYANARTILERTLNDPSTNKALSYYYLGQIEILYKNNEKAKADFEAGIKADPANPYNYVGMGAYCLRTGNAKEAETYFKEASKLAKKDHKIPVEIARAYYLSDPEHANAKNTETVRKYIDKARKDSKNHEPAIYMLEGDMLFDEGNRLGDAASQYEMAITEDQDNPAGYVKYARAYMGVNPEYGVAKLEELLAKLPKSALAQRELAERYYETNQWHKAVKQYGEYMANPNHFPEDKARYSFLLWVYKDYDKAVEVANEILANDPSNAQAQRIKLLALADLKNWEAADKAAQAFFTTPGIDFTQTDYLTYANVLKQLDRKDEALLQYEKALALNPDNVDLLKNVAYSYSDADHPQQAAEVFQKAIDNTENPSLTDVYSASGFWLVAAGSSNDPEEKKADAQKGIDNVDIVIAGTETNPTYLRRRAQLVYTRDNGEPTVDMGAAYEALVAALDADPANMDPANKRISWYSEAYRMLNKYYESIGDKDKQNAIIDKYAVIMQLQQQ